MLNIQRRFAQPYLPSLSSPIRWLQRLMMRSSPCRSRIPLTAGEIGLVQLDYLNPSPPMPVAMEAIPLPPGVLNNALDSIPSRKLLEKDHLERSNLQSTGLAARKSPSKLSPEKNSYLVIWLDGWKERFNICSC